MTYKATNIETLKWMGFPYAPAKFIAHFKAAMHDKGYDSALARRLVEAGSLGPIFSDGVLRAVDRDYVSRFLKTAYSDGIEQRPAAYRGTPEQNRMIDAAIARSAREYKGGARGAAGEGAATSGAFVTLNIHGQYDIRRTPIIIIGAGPAGVMTARGLTALGFIPDYIKIIDRQGVPGGIWTYPNVARLSRNNPKDLIFMGRELQKAPGGGREVYEFVQKLTTDTFGTLNPKNLIEGSVTRVEPGDLSTTVHYKTENGEYSLNAPIVINAIGLGSPVPLSDGKRMTTNAGARDAGPRWQQVLDGEKYDGKRLMLIGLGNSTAEMLTQINRLERQGYEIDYRVLTHYPADAVQNPNSAVPLDGRVYRVFRDLSIPNLVDFTGDLPEINEAYYKALMEGKIIPDVVRWDAKGGKLRARQRHGKSGEFATDAVFTLTGYRNRKEVLEALGLKLRDCGSVHYDYDGEFHARPGFAGKERVYRGYFGIGAVLDSPENPNAIVIPGMIHRMGDLLFGITMRAYEAAAERRTYAAEPKLIRALKREAFDETGDRDAIIAGLLGDVARKEAKRKGERYAPYDSGLVAELIRASQNEKQGESYNERRLPPAPKPVRALPDYIKEELAEAGKKK